MTTQEHAQKNFDEWLSLDPIIPTSRNGDGEYENEAAFQLWKVAEFMYKRGVWDGAYQMQKNMLAKRDENEVVSLMHRAYWSDKGSDTQRMTRVFRELVSSGLLVATETTNQQE